MSLGGGRYQITADGPEDGKAARIEGVVGGLVKLAEVELPSKEARASWCFPAGILTMP